MLKVIELFSGIGAQAKAFQNIGINHKIIKTCDWDIYALISYAAIHKNNEFTNIMKQFSKRERERERERERDE